MRRLMVLFLSVFFVTSVWASDSSKSDLEDLNLAPDSYWTGPDLAGAPEVESTFTSGIATYNNLYGHDDTWDYDYWAGFAYSNLKDTTTSGIDGQYMAIPGSGAGSSDIYAVGYCSTTTAIVPTITLDKPRVLSGAYFTNTNYTYYSMLNGYFVAKKFEDGDWLKLTITGKNADGDNTGAVDFLLADGTDIVNTWTWVDLSGLGEVKSLTFSMSSSDTGDWGMNTPAYFATDGLNDEDGDGGGDSGCFITTIAGSGGVF